MKELEALKLSKINIKSTDYATLSNIFTTRGHLIFVIVRISTLECPPIYLLQAGALLGSSVGFPADRHPSVLCECFLTMIAILCYMKLVYAVLQRSVVAPRCLIYGGSDITDR